MPLSKAPTIQFVGADAFKQKLTPQLRQAIPALMRVGDLFAVLYQNRLPESDQFGVMCVVAVGPERSTQTLEKALELRIRPEEPGYEPVAYCKAAGLIKEER